MNLSERIAIQIAKDPRLASVPIPLVEEVTRHAIDALALMSWPDGITLSDAIESEWESCEGCGEMLTTEAMQHDCEGVPLCPECMSELVAESAK